MPAIDAVRREISCKVVYYGPGLGGKTTNLQFIYKKVDPNVRGKLVSLATQTERTLFFDFVPIHLGKIKNLNTRFHFYTVPGQSFYNRSRQAILKNVDGIVFVADSQEDRFDANIDSYYNMEENLQEYGYDLKKIPLVMQWNKRDMENIVSVEELSRELNPLRSPEFEAVAVNGTGVFETLREIVRLVMADIRSRLL
jgi:mutual gliding-motility protein MglA